MKEFSPGSSGFFPNKNLVIRSPKKNNITSTHDAATMLAMAPIDKPSVPSTLLQKEKGSYYKTSKEKNTVESVELEAKLLDVMSIADMTGP